jgi:hypothetical protein
MVTRQFAGTGARIAGAACCVLGLWSAADRAAEPTLQPIVALVEPSIENGPLRDYWPGAKDREAHIVLRLTVGADGKALDVQVIDGFFEPRFAEAAVKLANEIRFKPATRAGVPEAFEGFVFAVNFQLGNVAVQGITPSFRSELNKAVALIKAGQFPEAHMQVEHMLADEVKVLYEINVLQAILAETHQSIGNLPEALDNSRKATETTDLRHVRFKVGGTPPYISATRFMLPEPLLSATLRRRLILDAKLGYVRDALQAYWELAGRKTLEPGDAVQELVPKLERLLASPAPLTAAARIGQDGRWTHEPTRRAFTVTDVSGGHLKDIRVNCGTYRRVLTYQPDVDWTLPPIYSRCGLTFTGEPGTDFRIAEADVPTGPDAQGIATAK